MAGTGRHRGQPLQPDGIAQELTFLPLVQTAAPSLVAALHVITATSATLTAGQEPAATVPIRTGITATLSAASEPGALVPISTAIEATLTAFGGLVATVPVTVGITAELTGYSGLVATVGIRVAASGRLAGRTTTVRSGELGCGVYELIFFQRGGVVAVGSLPFSDLSWGRDLDAISAARMTLTGLQGEGAACCSLASSLMPWQHEMGIYRDGARVWAGPIITVDVDQETVTIEARDLGQWFTRRRLRSDHVYAATDLATIFVAFADDALSVDNSMGIALVASPTGITGDRTTLSDQHLIAADQMDELARTGVDWTVVDRQFYIGGQQVPVPSAASGSLLLVDESFMTPPKATRDGMAQATAWGVRGAGVGQVDDVFGEASDAGLVALYGWLDQVQTEQTILDPTSAAQAAATRLALAGATPVVVSEGVLAPSAGVTIDVLVPGALVELRVVEQCIPISTRYRLASVAVSVSASQDEQVIVGFQPVGTEGTS